VCLRAHTFTACNSCVCVCPEILMSFFFFIFFHFCKKKTKDVGAAEAMKAALRELMNMYVCVCVWGGCLCALRGFMNM
jgi:hypothetical protein